MSLGEGSGASQGDDGDLRFNSGTILFFTYKGENCRKLMSILFSEKGTVGQISLKISDLNS